MNAKYWPVLALVIAALAGCGKKINSYDDCILENVPQAKSNLAVNLVVQSCEAKFPQG